MRVEPLTAGHGVRLRYRSLLKALSSRYAALWLVCRLLARRDTQTSQACQAAFDNLTWPTCAHLIWPTHG